jgi:mannose-1-phosphate guanylyltransferase
VYSRKKLMISVLIMAGGSGERFWPLSTREKPKQVLNLFSNKSMIRETVDRVLPLIPIEKIYIATNEVQEKIIRENLPDLPYDNLILEPLFKDTAAAIGYGTIYIQQRNPDSIIAVLASDHTISNAEEFRRCLQLAEIEAAQGHIVTFGIKPTKPETGYGYIQTQNTEFGKASKVVAFREKPNLETAKKYLHEGNFLWNSGMFIFKSTVLLENFRKHAHNHFLVLSSIQNKTDTIKNLFEKFEKISIDYAIIEKSTDTVVIPVDFGWNDVGSFNAFDDILEKNSNNTVEKNTVLIEVESSNNIVVGNGTLIATIGLHDFIIVQTGNELLIAKKSEAQKIKDVLKIKDNMR